MRWTWYLLTSFAGRISRWQFWVGLVLAIIPIFLVGFLGAVLDVAFQTREITQLSMLAGLHPLTVIFENAAALFFGSALAVKRLHDRNKRALWLQVQIIPLLGSIWLAIELGFLRGTKGWNDWGEDPRRERSIVSADA